MSQSQNLKYIVIDVSDLGPKETKAFKRPLL